MPEIEDRLVAYLKDAHALEQMSLKMLESATKTLEDAHLKEAFSHHLEETREHNELIDRRLEAHGHSPSMMKDVGQKATAMVKGMAAKAPADTPGRLARDGFVQENAEIAAYELLSRVAERAGDTETAEVARRILADEHAMAEKIAGMWDHATELALIQAGVR
jgi:ferritin-like metal-binding protein YciE